MEFKASLGEAGLLMKYISNNPEEDNWVRILYKEAFHIHFLEF